MGILFIEHEAIPEAARKYIRLNHRLYGRIHQQDIAYSKNYTENLEFILKDETCIVLSEQYVFVNLDISYKEYLDNDHYLYLVSNTKIKNINDSIDNIFITKSSNWLKLLLYELKKYNMSISQYINYHIDLSDITVELQNISVINKPIFMHISDTQKYNYIPQNILLTSVLNLSDDTIIDSVIYINKILGVNYV